MWFVVLFLTMHKMSIKVKLDLLFFHVRLISDDEKYSKLFM